ncbi:MAG: divergent polysaccharide deacetylase family protein, partial [Treponema sp.]|nr:divergent polysaccharide deacetylase family protein [Treponema sp.]
MACSIIAACALILTVTYLLSRASSSQMSENAWKKAPAGQPITQAEEIQEIGEPIVKEEKKSETPKKTKDNSSKSKKESKTKEITIIEPDVAKEVQKDQPKEQVESKVETPTQPAKTEKAQTQVAQQQAQGIQKETQNKVQTQSQQQTQASQKTVIQQQDKIASVKVDPTPQIQEVPKKLFDIPQAKSGTRICFVIDYAGANLGNLKRYTSLPFPITIAVLPKLAQSSECAQAVRAAGKELILHQPMQAHDYASGTTPNPGPGAILPGMDPY